MKRLFMFSAFLLAGAIAHAAAPPEVNLTRTIGPGNVPTLSWSVPWAVSCNAGGSWSGVKQPSGSETLPAIAGTVTYTLTCVGAADNKATLSWTGPTQYTDGSTIPVNGIEGYRVYRGSTSTNLQRFQDVSSLAYVDSNLLTGTYYYAVTAVSTQGLESGRSAIGSKTITAAPTGSDSETLRVPNPPTPGTVQ